MANKVTKNLKKVRTFCQNEIKKNDKTINKNSMDAKWKSIFGDSFNNNQLKQENKAYQKVISYLDKIIWEV